MSEHLLAHVSKMDEVQLTNMVNLCLQQLTVVFVKV